MPRYVIEEDRAIWVREVYEIEAESEEEAKELYYDGDYEYLGFSLKDSVDYIDCQPISIEQTDATPHMDHPFDEAAVANQ